MVFEAARLPILPGALELSESSLPGGGRTNQAHFGSRVAVSDRVDEPRAPGRVRSADVRRAADRGRSALAGDVIRGMERSQVTVWTVGRVESSRSDGILVCLE